MIKLVLSAYLILLFGLHNGAQCQNWETDTIEIDFKVYGVADGLSQSLVSSIVQDHNGYLWIGTKDGLNRYDGKAFKVYKHDEDNPNSLEDNNISHILIDSNERMWISTESKGLCSYNPALDGFEQMAYQNGQIRREVDRFFELGVDTFITTTSNLPAGNILFIEQNQQDDKEIAEISTCQYFPNLENFGFCSNSFQQLSDAEIDHSIYFNSQGKYFAAHQDNKLLCFNRASLLGHDSPTEIKLPSDFTHGRDSLFFFENDYSGETYFQFNNRDVYQIFPDEANCKKVFQLPQGRIFRNNHFFNRSGHMWLLLTNNSFARVDFKNNTIGIATIGDDLTGMYFQLEDKDGNLWFASDGYGLGKISSNFDNFSRFSAKKATIEGVWAYRFERPDKKAFYSKECARLWSDHSNTEFKKKLKERKFGFQYQLFIDSEDHAWLPVFDSRKKSQKLSRFPLDGNTDLIKELPFRKDSEYIEIMAVFSYKGDTVAIFNQYLSERFVLELYHKEVGIIESFPLPLTTGLKDTRFINDWLVEYPETIWLATIHGLMKLDVSSGEWKLWDDEGEKNSRLSNRSALSLCLDVDRPNDFLWIGTQGGLHKMHRQSGTFDLISTKNGLPNNTIYSIQSDDYSNYWLGTNKGLCRYNPEKDEFRTFTTEDGINGDEFNRFQWSKSPDGTMYFGGVEGVTSFQPKTFENNKEYSSVRVKELRLFNRKIDFHLEKNNPKQYILNQPIEIANDLIFDYDQSMITFVFGMVDFGDVAKQHYSFRLIGLNEEWIELREINEATFTNLDPGSYTLEVIGQNSHGNWSESKAEIRFKVLPPWWATWWFRALLLVSISYLVYALYRYRIGQILREERMRNQIAQDLHDEIGSTLSSISLYSAVMKSNEKALSQKSQPVLDRIITNVSDIMEKMNDMVWTIKSDNDSMDQVVNRMRAFAAEMSEARGIRLVFDSEPAVEKMKLDMNRRKEVYLIFKEAVNNAVKYSEASELFVQLKNSAGMLCLSIRDNGNGFDVAHPSQRSLGGNGIPGMKNRAERINAIFEICSSASSGTEIVLKVPINH